LAVKDLLSSQSASVTKSKGVKLLDRKYEKGRLSGKPPLIGRRAVVLGAGAIALNHSIDAHAKSQAAAAPNDLIAQPGDHFQIIKGESRGKLLRPELLSLGARPVEAFPFDRASSVLRRGNRLNRLLVLRLQSDEMDDATRERSVEGVLAFSAMCTHRACTISAWKSEERHLLCFCHLSQFAVLTGGTVMAGPARRQLPMIPLGINEEGFVVAKKGFTAKPGGAKK
jgi:rieske iron-sulfur protein